MHRCTRWPAREPVQIEQIPTWALCVTQLVLVRVQLYAVSGTRHVGIAFPATSRPATWLVSTFSVVHYVTAINLIGHPELRRDFLVRLVVVLMYIVHALAGLAIVFMLALAVPLNEAWGCYPPGKTLAQHNLGPCGESTSLPWVDPNPQAVCRSPEVQDYTMQTGACEAVLSGEQVFGPALAFALHAEAVAAAAYTLGCIHAYTIYFSDLKSPLPMRAPMAAFLQ